MPRRLTFLSGSANPELAEAVSRHLGVPLTPVDLKRFNDGETYAKVLHSVRGSHVFVLQPTSPPTNDHLMELLIILDALKRASAKEITVILPYFGYARQDRKSTSREPITAKLVADLLETAGADRVVVFDLHVDQIQGFFNIPVDNINAMPILAKPIKEKGLKDLVVVSTDVGGVIRTRRFAEALGVEMAIIDKRRTAHGVSEVMHVIGEVEGKNAVLVDDIIDTAGSILNAVVALKKHGAKDIYVCATHAVLSKDALTKLGSPDIREVFVTDSIHVPKEKRLSKLKVVTIAPFLAEIIAAIYEGKPMGALVEGKYTASDLQKE